jgi:LacI family transcriptional regulator
LAHKSPPARPAVKRAIRNTTRATIREVAQRASVSLTTVSRVINNAVAVRPVIRARVTGAMEELGYVPDAIAQSLRTQSTRTVGCIVPDISFPAFSNTIGAAEERLRTAGYTMQVMATQELPEREMEILSLCRGRRLSGLITTIGRDDDPAIQELLESLMVPAVLLDRKLPVPIDSVCTDHFFGALRATEYLLQLGHRNIGLITLSEHALPGRERRRAFQQAHSTQGLSCNPAWIVGPGFESDHAYKIAYDLLTAVPRPTAIMAGGFPMIGVMRAARTLGISIPQELSLISFGDTDFADLLSPPLTVVRWDNREIGRIAAEILVSRMSGAPREVPTQVVLPSELIVRGSCASLRAST